MAADSIKMTFRRFDHNNDGFISRQELKQVVRFLGHDWEDATFHALFLAADGDHDDRLAYEEFVDWLFEIGHSAHRSNGFCPPPLERNITEPATSSSRFSPMAADLQRSSTTGSLPKPIQPTSSWSEKRMRGVPRALPQPSRLDRSASQRNTVPQIRHLTRTHSAPANQSHRPSASDGEDQQREQEILALEQLRSRLSNGQVAMSEVMLQRVTSATGSSPLAAEACGACLPSSPVSVRFGSDYEPSGTLTGDVCGEVGECGICFEKELEVIHPCGRTVDFCTSKFCRRCSGQHATTIVDAALYAMPWVKCPGCRGRVATRVWSGLVDEKTAKQYHDNAVALLTYRCPGCHQPNTLFQRYPDMDDSRRVALELEIFGTPSEDDLTGDISSEVLRRTWMSYSCADLSADALLSQLVDMAALRSDGTGETEESDGGAAAPPEWLRKEMSSERIPALIEDPERCCSLQLAFLRRFPGIVTPCCKRQMCFRCKIAGWHPGVSCEERQHREAGVGVQFCPGCGVPTIRSEGCDHIVCVCGASWTWSTDPLRSAVEAGQVDRVQAILSEGVERSLVVAALVKLVATPLENSSLEIARLLLTHGADGSLEPLRAAVQASQLENLSVLLSAGMDGSVLATALVESARKPLVKDTPAVIRLLLEHRAQVNLTSEGAEGHNAALLEMLSALQGEILRPSWAADHRVIEYGGRRGVMSWDGRQAGEDAGYIAAYWEDDGTDSDVISVAETEITSVESQRAEVIERTRAACAARAVDVVKLLVDARADVNLVGSNQSTVLCEAIRTEVVSILSIVLGAGECSTLDLADASGHTPLILCIDLGQNEMVSLLLAAGASASAPGAILTPLTLAIANVNWDVFVRLLEASADVAMREPNTQNDGYQPLHVVLKCLSAVNIIFGGVDGFSADIQAFYSFAAVEIKWEREVKAKSEDGADANELSCSEVRAPAADGDALATQETDCSVKVTSNESFWCPALICGENQDGQVLVSKLEKGSPTVNVAMKDVREWPAGGDVLRRMLQRMLESRADVNAASHGGHPLSIVASGPVDVVKLLLQHSAEADHKVLASALLFPLHTDALECTKLLIEAHADVNAQPPLEVGPIQGYDQEELTKPESQDPSETTAADDKVSEARSTGNNDRRESSSGNSVEAAIVQVKAGTAQNSGEEDGCASRVGTALMELLESLSWCHDDLVSGSSATRRLGAVRNVDDASVIPTRPSESQTDRALELTQLLLTSRAEVTVRGQGLAKGTTPLILAIESAFIEVAAVIIEAVQAQAPEELDMLEQNQFGWTPLTAAASYNRTGLVSMLLNARASVNKQRFYGRSPLHETIRHACVETVALLASFRADVSVVSHEGLTPLHMALEVAGATGSFRNERRPICQWTLAEAKENEVPGYEHLNIWRPGTIILLGSTVRASIGWMHKSHVSMLPLQSIRPWPDGCDRLSNIVGHLLEQAASVNDIAGDGSTPLTIAAAGGEVPLVDLLVRYGAGVNVTGHACGGVEGAWCGESDGLKFQFSVSRETEPTEQYVLIEATAAGSSETNGRYVRELASEIDDDISIQVYKSLVHATVSIWYTPSSSPDGPAWWVRKKLEDTHHNVYVRRLEENDNGNLTLPLDGWQVCDGDSGGLQPVLRFRVLTSEPFFGLSFHYQPHDDAAVRLSLWRVGLWHQGLFQFENFDFILMHTHGRIKIRSRAESTNKLLPKDLVSFRVTDHGSGIAPLAAAARNGHVEVVRALLLARADVEQKDQQQHTAFHHAAKNWTVDQGRVAVIEHLLATGAFDVDAQDHQGCTPLVLAATRTGFLEMPCDRHRRSDNGLELSTEHESCILRLIEARADVDHVALAAKTTPLLSACRCGDEKIASLLLKHSAAVNLPVEDIRPLGMALQRRSHLTVQALMVARADLDAVEVDAEHEYLLKPIPATGFWRYPVSPAAEYAPESSVESSLAEQEAVLSPPLTDGESIDGQELPP